MIFDQYSLLHFATGIIAYFWGVGAISWAIIHSIFEFLENTKYSIQFVNKYIPIWPGGKQQTDSVQNMIGDTISAIVGWFLAYYIDFVGVKHGWYEGHIVK